MNFRTNIIICRGFILPALLIFSCARSELVEEYPRALEDTILPQFSFHSKPGTPSKETEDADKIVQGERIEKIQSSNCKTFPKKIITLFSHGIADTYKQAYAYAKSYIKHGITYFNERFVFHTPYVAFNYPDAIKLTTKGDKALEWINVKRIRDASFGQKNEIDRLHSAFKHTMDRYEDCDIILWGISRGAANQVIFAGLHSYNNVKAILLESPYNSMTEVIESMMNKKNLGWMNVSYGETIAEFIFKKYTRHGWSPKKFIEKISKDIPILIICSQQDETVPCASSINVYKNLVAAGHKHTYILITEHGRHAKILQGPDGEIYQWVVNAFYKKYNLPHCPISAAKGEHLLALCQPSL